MYSNIIKKQDEIFGANSMDYHRNVEVHNKTEILAYIKSEPILMMYAEIPDDYELFHFNALKELVEDICSKILCYIDLGYKVFLNSKPATSKDIERIITFREGTFSDEFVIQDSKYLNKTFKDDYIITSQVVDSNTYYYTKKGYKSQSEKSCYKKPSNDARKLIAKILNEGNINAIVADSNNRYLKALVYKDNTIKFCLG